MAKENDTKIDGQLTLFDIFGNAGDFGRKYSVSDIDKAMENCERQSVPFRSMSMKKSAGRKMKNANADFKKSKNKKKIMSVK